MSTPGSLVRDGKREIVEARGERHMWRQATGDELRRLLVRKLDEECGEAAQAAMKVILGHDAQAELAVELADVIEVVLQLGISLGVSPGSIRNAAVLKKASEGGYSGLVWEGPADEKAAEATRLYEAGKVKHS